MSHIVEEFDGIPAFRYLEAGPDAYEGSEGDDRLVAITLDGAARRVPAGILVVAAAAEDEQ